MIRWPSVEPAALLAHWPRGLGEAKPFVSSGLSGAFLWRVGDVLALRVVPVASCSLEVMLQRHRWMRLARSAGLRVVPDLVPHHQGGTALVHGPWIVEMQQWMPGAADMDERPQPIRVRQACQTLGLLHRIWRQESQSSVRAPAIERRLAECRDGELERWRERSWRLQPCLVDIHREHVLFEGQQVSGIVDYATAQWDIPHADLARLLGSLAEDDEALWQAGLDAYAQVAPLPEVELIRRLDRVGAWIALQRWERWRAAGPLPPAAQRRWERLHRRVSAWNRLTE
jgi:Ser/Thr protein kinase RdoA (MazF antagonist)